jgi:hypothetical protein
VVRAIDLDRKSRLVAAEIYHIAVDRHLSAELPPIEAATSQLAPKDILGARALRSKAAGESDATRHGPQRNLGKRATPTFSHGERVSPKATGEGRALSGKGVPLTRTAVAVSTSSHGRGDEALR